MEAKVGDTVRSILNGKDYQVKKFVKSKAFSNRKTEKVKLSQRLQPLSYSIGKRRI